MESLIYFFTKRYGIKSKLPSELLRHPGKKQWVLIALPTNIPRNILAPLSWKSRSFPQGKQDLHHSQCTAPVLVEDHSFLTFSNLVCCVLRCKMYTEVTIWSVAFLCRGRCLNWSKFQFLSVGVSQSLLSMGLFSCSFAMSYTDEGMKTLEL